MVGEIVGARAWKSRLAVAERKWLTRAGFGLRYQRLKLRVGCKQLVHQLVIFLRIERLNCQQSVVGHLDDHGLARLGTLIQGLFEVHFQAAQRDSLDDYETPLLPQGYAEQLLSEPAPRASNRFRLTIQCLRPRSPKHV